MNRYETYKDSGISWLGEVPDHWEVKRLKFLARIQNGADYKHVETNDGYPVIGSGGQFAYANSYLYDGESVLLGRKGTIDKPLYVNGKFWTVDTMYYTEILKNTYPKYLYYLTLTIDFGRYSTQTALPSMTQTALNNLVFAVPHYKEQTAIAHYLDAKLGEIDALIGKQQTLLEKLAEQRTAVITHAVTKGLNPAAPMKNSGVEWLGDVPAHWEIIKNKYILEFSKGLTITKENLINDGIPCVSYGEIHSKYGFEVNPGKHFLKCVSEEYLENNDHAYLKNGDFVFADTSEDVKGSGNFTYLNSNLPVFAGYHTIVARPNLRKVLPRFLAYVFDSNAHRNQIRAMVKGVKVFSITQAFLKNTFSWLPSKKEQTAIAEYLDNETAKIDRLCDTVNQTIGRLKEYRTALITQAVTGKIKVTDE